MNPITNMAFYCCGVRMQDAEQNNSLCGDVYAKLFMDAYGLRIYDEFKGEVNCNLSMLIRHRLIDDVLRRMLLANPDLCVITIGAGFDSRPYRLAGGTWIELDEPPVIAYKNLQLPTADCANPLQRVPINFCTDSLEEKLSFISHAGPIAVVMEGVFIYLDESEIKEIFSDLHKLFPTHRLICDLVNREMVQTYGQSLHQKIEKSGTLFKPVETPETIFTSNDYRMEKKISIAESAADFGICKLPKFVLRFFYNANIKGNAVYVFESHEPYSDLVI